MKCVIAKQDGMTNNHMTRSVPESRLKWPVWILWLCCLLVPLAQARTLTNPTAYVMGSGNEALDRHITTLLRSELDDKVELIPFSDSLLPLTAGQPVIAIGPAALSRFREQQNATPVLALLVEKQTLDRFASGWPGQVTAVYYDVPLIRQALTGKAILPQATRISILATIVSADMYEPLIDELEAYELQARVFIVSSEEELIPTLNRALAYGDFVLAGPDDQIYNPRNIKHILLTAYRRNRILIGPNQAYVKAGSLASSYAPFTAMARQAADYLVQFFDDGKFPAPDYPAEYRVELNQQVARSLNIPLPDRQWIAETVNRFVREQQEASQ